MLYILYRTTSGRNTKLIFGHLNDEVFAAHLINPIWCVHLIAMMHHPRLVGTELWKAWLFYVSQSIDFGVSNLLQ